MYDDPEHEEYDDDEYKYYPDGGLWKNPPHNNDEDKKNFSIDWKAWELWLQNTIKEITQEENSNTWVVGENKFIYYKKEKDGESLQYIGSNTYQEQIWTKKYFLSDKMHQEYLKHLRSHASYFLTQPHYYKNMFNILN